MMGLFGIDLKKSPKVVSNPSKAPNTASSSSPSVEKVNSLMFNSGGGSTPTSSPKPWESKFERASTDKDYARSEVLRAKQEYEKAQKSGASPDRLTQIRRYADQIRQHGGLDNSQYGANVNYDTASQNYSGGGNNTPQQQQPMAPPVPQQNPQLEMWQNKFSELMGNMNNYQSEIQQQWQQQAQQQAQQIAEEKRNALRSLIDKLKTNQEVGLQGINNSVEDAKQSLEDRSFQQYLAARQQMANRGLSGSGIASDQDTRLLLQKQRDLSGIYRDAATRQFQLGNQYRNQLDDANTQLSGVNTGQIAADQFNQLYQQGQEGLMSQAELYQKYLSDLMGYDVDLKNNQFDYDKLSSEEQREYDQMNLDLLQGNRDYSIDLSKQTGYLYGANGQPILDSNGQMISLLEREKLDETIRRNKAAEEVDWANVELKGDELIARVTQWTEENRLDADRIDLDEREFAAKQEEAKQMITKTIQEASSEKVKNEIKMYSDQLDDVSKEINSYIRQSLQDTPAFKEANRKYNEVLKKLNATIQSSGFSSSAKGGEVDVKPDGTYNNLFKTKQMGGLGTAKYNSTAKTVQKALEAKGLPKEWLPYVMEISARESSWNPTAQNPNSSAYGMFQFIDSTWKNYGHKKTDDPYKQTLAGLDYIKKRYGTPQKALAKWDQRLKEEGHGWY